MTTGTRCLVLVVHDDLGTRGVLCDALLDAGYSVSAASRRDVLHGGGAGGAPAWSRDPTDVSPGLVLLDAFGDARPARAALARRYGADVPVVALTTDPNRWGGPEIGAAAQLPMPFDLDDLVALVARFCGASPN